MLAQDKPPLPSQTAQLSIPWAIADAHGLWDRELQLHYVSMWDEVKQLGTVSSICIEFWLPTKQFQKSAYEQEASITLKVFSLEISLCS